MSKRSNAWNESTQSRWARIQRHAIGGEDVESVFAARLAREQGWSESQAADAIEEYRRFVFLSGVAGHEVTPSQRVDAVWHLHLLFTRDYWGAFAETLGGALHHDPGVRAADAPRHRDQYRQTLDSYECWFGPAPTAWWPRPASRPVAPAARATRRIPAWRRTAPWRWVALVGIALLPAAVWAARPADPLDWSGRDFLVLYLALMFGAAIVSLILRSRLRRSAVEAPRHVGSLTATEVALLAGGAQRAIDASVAELHARGAIEWDAQQRRLVRSNDQGPLEDPLRSIALAVTEGPMGLRSMRIAVDALKPVAAGLERRGLWIGKDAARRIGRIAALPTLLVLGFGVSKIGLGLARGKPVSLLVMLCLITAAFAAAMYFGRPRRSRFGDEEVAKLRAQQPARGQSQPSQLAYAVALGGTAVFAGTALAGWHEARAAGSGGVSGGSDSSSDSGGDSGSSGSDGGSGCGGCGGGGD